MRATRLPSRAPQSKMPPRARTRFRLHDLPGEVQLHVCDFLTHQDDIASLCLASPRLGREAIRHCASFKDPLVAVGLALSERTPCQLLDERLLRRYAGDGRATEAGVRWLAEKAEAAGWPLRIAIRDGKWYMMDGGVEGAKLRWRDANGNIRHYVGERQGRERVVRVVDSDGDVLTF